jgi:hypothetical protein
MILIAPPDPEWDSKDRAVLEEFIQSPTGQRLIGVLAFYQPEFGNGSDASKTLVASGRVEGYADAVGRLIRLMKEHPSEPNKQQTSKAEYPDLDDDEAWKAHGLGAVDKNPS